MIGFVILVLLGCSLVLLGISIAQAEEDGGLEYFCWKREGPRTVLDFLIFACPIYWLVRLVQTRIR